jgi:hypothetical protein
MRIGVIYLIGQKPVIRLTRSRRPRSRRCCPASGRRPRGGTCHRQPYVSCCCDHPFVRPLTYVSASLFRRWHSDGFYMTAVECLLLRPILRARDRRQQLLPDAPVTPPREAVVNRLIGPVSRRTILPAITASLHVRVAAEYPPAIVSRWFPRSCGSIFAHCSSPNQKRLAFMAGLRTRWPPPPVESTHGQLGLKPSFVHLGNAPAPSTRI